MKFKKKKKKHGTIELNMNTRILSAVEIAVTCGKQYAFTAHTNVPSNVGRIAVFAANVYCFQQVTTILTAERIRVNVFT